MEKRKGSIRAKDIPNDILIGLNTGVLESVNLTEWLIVDHKILLNTVLISPESRGLLADIIESIKLLKKPSTTKIIKLIGSKIANHANKDLIIESLKGHPSDSVRCWVAHTIGFEEGLSLENRLSKIYEYAADTHFGVREIAWMAVRPHYENKLKEVIKILSNWTNNEDENIRRFASESTRPRGVWCKHIDTLKLNPELAMPILNPLKADKSRYVQDSVANWLNDASKTVPDWVLNCCSYWLEESPCKETQYIAKKAQRTINKLKNNDFVIM